MPFIKQELRQPLLTGQIKPQAVGELCFLRYADMMEKWKDQPRWTTIHNMCKEAMCMNDMQASAFLAFLEFYFNHGHFYELEKKEENGDIGTDSDSQHPTIGF